MAVFEVAVREVARSCSTSGSAAQWFVDGSPGESAVMCTGGNDLKRPANMLRRVMESWLCR